MIQPPSLSDAELVARLPRLVQAERHAMADVIEHLVEVERRRLYLRASACSSLYRYCIDQLGYSEDAALKRHRVARLALRLPLVLEELRRGSIQLTGLFLLAKHLTAENAEVVLADAGGKSRRQVEELIAQRFPRPDVAPSITLLPATAATWPGAGNSHVQWRLEPLAPGRVRVEFTARAELYDKLERARELLSNAIPSGDLGAVVERAVDALLEQARRPARRPRQRRALENGSRHVPLEVKRAVWERDAGQCTFVDGQGRRCGQRRFLTLEHCRPFARGGPATVENLCLLCSAHNLASAREVFGEKRIDARIRASRQSTSRSSDTEASRALDALCHLGFRRADAAQAIERVLHTERASSLEQLLRTSLALLVRDAA